MKNSKTAFTARYAEEDERVALERLLRDDPAKRVSFETIKQRYIQGKYRLICKIEDISL